MAYKQTQATQVLQHSGKKTASIQGYNKTLPNNNNYYETHTQTSSSKLNPDPQGNFDYLKY